MQRTFSTYARFALAAWLLAGPVFSHEPESGRVAAPDAPAAKTVLAIDGTRFTINSRPRRSFDLRERSLFEQMDAEESRFIESLPRPD